MRNYFYNTSFRLLQKTYSVANTPVGSSVSGSVVGAVVAWYLTKSYRDEEIKILNHDIENLKSDLKESNKKCESLTGSVHSTVASLNDLRNFNLIKTDELRNLENQLRTCLGAASEYKFCYERSFCFFRERPRLSNSHENVVNPTQKNST